MAVTQAQFDREFEANLRNANFDLRHKDVVELLELLGATIHNCLHEDIKNARRQGWGRKSTPRSKRRHTPPSAPRDGKVANPKVIVRGVGTFGVREYPEREGRNPQTGEKLRIPASQRMRVAAPKPLRDALGVK